MKTMEEIEGLWQAFNQQTLKKEAWTHEAHLIVAIVFLKRFDYSEAICRIRSGIICLNKAHGILDTGTSGYHETFTLFWISVIDLFIKHRETMDLPELTEAFLSSPLADRKLPFLFYEKNEVLSASYRAHYYPPSLKTLDGSTLRTFMEKSKES